MAFLTARIRVRCSLFKILNRKQSIARINAHPNLVTRMELIVLLTASTSQKARQKLVNSLV